MNVSTLPFPPSPMFLKKKSIYDRLGVQNPEYMPS